MSLDAARLAVGIKAALVASGALDAAGTTNLALAIATAVVNEIKDHATVTGTATGVQGGGATAPVTGTVT